MINRQFFLRGSLAAMLSLFAAVPMAWAGDTGTKDEAVAMVTRAAAHVKKVGPAQAYKDFSTDKDQWQQKDLYIFAVEMNGTMVAHGTNERLIGKNLLELKDQNGKAFVKEYLAQAEAKGSGWTDYEWPNPVSKKIESKSSYVRKLDGVAAVVGVGVYR